MSDNTEIEWSDMTIPLIAGCTKQSRECANCWAIRDSHRLSGNPNVTISRVYKGTTIKRSSGVEWSGVVRPIEDRLSVPRTMQRQPVNYKIFVASQGDLFHPLVPFEFIGEFFDEMIAIYRYCYQLLTKQTERMNEFVEWYMRERGLTREQFKAKTRHIWFGFSAGQQKTFDKLWPHVASLPVRLRWLSAEPLLSRVVIPEAAGSLLGWVVVGGETGPKDKIDPMHIEDARELRDYCEHHGVPYFFKQWGNLKPADDDGFFHEEPKGTFTLTVSVKDLNTRYVTVTEHGGKRDGWITLNNEGWTRHFRYYQHKRDAGRLLDGVEHSAFPAPR
jgi:protein gp37